MPAATGSPNVPRPGARGKLKLPGRIALRDQSEMHVESMSIDSAAAATGPHIIEISGNGLSAQAAVSRSLTALTPAGTDPISVEAAAAFAAQGAQFLTLSTMAQQYLTHAGAALIGITETYNHADNTAAGTLTSSASGIDYTAAGTSDSSASGAEDTSAVTVDDGTVNALVAGLGTSGTLMGTGRYLKENKPGVKIIAIEPPLGERVEGLRNLEDGYIPPVFEQWYGFDLLDRKRVVRPRESLEWTRRLVHECGIFAGISAGAALAGAAKVASEIDEGTIVFIVCDGGWKYLSTGAYTDDLDEAELKAERIIYF